MNRGCLIALVASGVCVLILIVTVIVVPLYMFDVIRSAPRVPVATFLTEDSVAALRVDPNDQQFLDMINGTNGNLGWFLPHEVGVVVDLDSARKTRTITIAGSPKHLGPAFMLMFGEANTFTETIGVDTWLTPALTREKGAIILRGQGGVEEKTENLALEHWPEVAPRMPAKFEGGHTLEIVVQNHSGEGILALEPFFREEATEEQEPVRSFAGTMPEEPDHAEAVESGAEMAEANPDEEVAEKEASESPDDEPTEKNDELVAGIFQFASELHIAGDFSDDNTFKLTITAQNKDEDSAVKTKTILDIAPSIIQNDLGEKGLTVTGTSSVTGTTVTGEIVFSGYKERFAAWLQDMQR